MLKTEGEDMVMNKIVPQRQSARDFLQDVSG